METEGAPGGRASDCNSGSPLMRVHFHTDCRSFAGCEQMLVVLLDAYSDASFTYRWSLDYERGAVGRLPSQLLNEGALRLPDAARLREHLALTLRGHVLKMAKAFTMVLPVRQVFQVWDVLVLYRRMRWLRPDVLHINNGGFPGGASCNAAVVAARLARIRPIIYVVNNQAEHYRWPPRWYDWPLDRLVARWVDRFVTGSLSAAEALRRVLRLSKDRVVTIHNGIASRQADETREATRSRLGLPLNSVVIAAVARLEPRKGLNVLIEALARLDRGCAIAVIEGEGPELPGLVKLADSLGLQDRVRFVGSERNVFNLISASDVLVLPSLAYEDFPNIVLEAMSLAKPVVASRLAGIPEQVVEGETGLLVEANEPCALAEALAVLVTDADLRERMGRAGLARFEKFFTAEEAAQRYGELYLELRQPFESGPRRRNRESRSRAT